MMRFFVWLLIFILVLFSFPAIGQSQSKPLFVSAENTVLMEQETGRVLFEKAAHEQKEIASITKVMTAIVALEYGNLDDKVKISRNAAFTTGSSIYLEINEKMTLKDLLYGLMLRSGNDAAVAIAEHVGGSEEGFTFLMNETASYIGMTNTHFMNPHGLDEENHYSSAYDMALLMQYAMNNKAFQKLSNETSYKSENRTYPWRNKNKLLTRLYEPCTGGKTGYTQQAGRTLISSAQKGNLSFIVVTLNAPDDWNDHINLYNWGFDNFTLKKVEKKGEKQYQLRDKQISGYIREDVVLPLHDDEVTALMKQVVLFENPNDNQKIGEIQYKNEQQTIIEIPVYKENNLFIDRFYQVFFNFLRLDDYG